MHRGSASVIAAQALIAHGIDNETIAAYVQQTWCLDQTDACAAVAAAHTLAGEDHGIRIASPVGSGYLPGGRVLGQVGAVHSRAPCAEPHTGW